MNGLPGAPDSAAVIFVSVKPLWGLGLWASPLFTLSSLIKPEKDQLYALLAFKADEKGVKEVWPGLAHCHIVNTAEAHVTMC